MRVRSWAGLLLTVSLAACSSTSPSQPVGVASAAPQSMVAPAASPTAVAHTSEGPVTPSMAQLELSGERFAVLGDPDAPVTVVEFSDYG